MHDYSFYSAILGLSSKWHIMNVTVDEHSREVELHISGREESRFSCPTCGVLKLPSGTSKSRWLYENRLNIRFYITASIPVITCECCGEMKAETPWERSGTTCEAIEVVDSERKADSAPLQLS